MAAGGNGGRRWSAGVDGALPAFDEFVGTPDADSELDVYWFEPTAAGWQQGDRTPSRKEGENDRPAPVNTSWSIN